MAQHFADGKHACTHVIGNKEINEVVGVLYFLTLVIIVYSLCNHSNSKQILQLYCQMFLSFDNYYNCAQTKLNVPQQFLAGPHFLSNV